MPVDSSLKQIEALYNSAQYVTAELEARRLYEEMDLTDSARVQIEKWVAFSLIAQGKSSIARERFVTLLSINPDFELDPVLTSPKILSVFYEAKTKFLSLEPLLGPLNDIDLYGIDWVIVGGESGPGARPMNPEWVLDIRDQCLQAKVPFFFKQWGGFNKKKNGRILEGRTWDQVPKTITGLVAA